MFSLEAKGNTKENESQWLITFIDFDKVFMKILWNSVWISGVVMLNELCTMHGT